MRTWLIAAAVALIGSTARADDAKPDPKAAEVVTKAVEAFGGKAALDKYPATTGKVKGQVSILGVDMEFTGDMAVELPKKFKMAINAEFMGQKLAIVQLVNGEKSKMTVNGMEQPLPDALADELKNNLVEQEMYQITPLLDPKKYTLKLGDDAEVNGKKARLVVVSGPKLKDKEVKLYFDAETGLLAKLARKGIGPDGMKEVDEETTFDDYKKVQGVMHPHKMAVKQDGKPFMTMTVSDLKMADKLEAKEFATDD